MGAHPLHQDIGWNLKNTVHYKEDTQRYIQLVSM